MFAQKQNLAEKPLARGRTEVSTVLYKFCRNSNPECQPYTSADQPECICIPVWRAGAVLPDSSVKHQ